jgi:hypothetical protein
MATATGSKLKGLQTAMEKYEKKKREQGLLGLLRRLLQITPQLEIVDEDALIWDYYDT